MSDLHDLTAAEQLEALRTRQLSSRELTEHYLTRIDRLDHDLAAFVTVTADLARCEADRADQRLARGDRAPLLGLPIGIKDMHFTAGVRTTLGSAALSDFVPPTDGWTVGLLRQAGAVLVGKTSSAEFGATCFTHDSLRGAPTVTPYDLTRSSSGSSGGAAAAVAAGLLPIAHASDGAGSTRTPASTCHLVGVKPSRGLVSMAPSGGYLSFGTEGPLARTVTDAALLLDVMAQPWPGDLYGWTPSGKFVDALQQVTSPQRVAVLTDTGVPGVAPHLEAVAAVHRTADMLEQLGHEVHEITVPAHIDEATREALARLFVASLSSAVPAAVPSERLHMLTPYTRELLSRAPQLTAADVLDLQNVLAQYASTFLTALAPFDVTLTPTTNGPPVPVEHYLAEGPGSVFDRMLAWSCYTPWANFTGQPAVALPSHLDDDGLPQGVQLVARPRRDAQLFALAAQLEQAQLWKDVHPPCWDQ